MIYLLRDSDRSYFDTKKYFSGGVRRISGNELYTNMGEMFHVVKMTRDNLTVTKGSEDYFYFNFPKKDGYSRVVMDIKVENASSNGYGVTYFKYITYKTPDDKSITIYGKNENTSRDIKLWMQVIVMYVNEKYANW